MREILFRGKRTDNGEWVQGNLLLDQDLEQAQIVWFDYKSTDDGVERDGDGAIVIPETVCQFTGLTDKNGRKIFEGDIVKMRAYGVGYHCTSVYFRDGKFAVDGTQYHFKNICSNSVEVIGNIYDNPELLKGGSENG